VRLLIVQPTHYLGKTRSALHKTRKRSVVCLTLPYLAALTPPGWEIRLLDEQLSDIDFQAPVDLVAITTWTINSFRAYDIADRFRDRGVRVIMGGPHTCFYSEEALEHCDAVGLGEGEEIFPRMLEDAAAGQLQRVYRAQGMHHLTHLPFPRYDLLDFRGYGLIKSYSVQSSRGCPFRCEFCSERFYLGHEYRSRPVEEVVEEIKRIRGKNILFADSNFTGKKAHAMALMEALVPLRIRWSALWSANFCRDREFVDLAKRSGLLHVNIGIESLDESTLAGMNKRANRAAEYEDLFAHLRRRGISHSANLIFGWETETRDVFESTLSFLQEQKVAAAYFNILTPHRGTPFYDRMKAEGKIIDDYHIGRWAGVHCHIQPPYCTPEEMEESVLDLYRRFYSLRSIFKRLPLPLTMGAIASWVVNLGQRRVALSGGDAENFDGI